MVVQPVPYSEDTLEPEQFKSQIDGWYRHVAEAVFKPKQALVTYPWVIFSLQGLEDNMLFYDKREDLALHKKHKKKKNIACDVMVFWEFNPILYRFEKRFGSPDGLVKRFDDSIEKIEATEKICQLLDESGYRKRWITQHVLGFIRCRKSRFEVNIFARNKLLNSNFDERD